jgi:dUTP pyrophosphatase
VKLKWKVTRPGGVIYEPVHPGDVGFDMEAVETVWLAPGQMADIPLGVAVELPVGRWGDLRHRSSTPRKLGVMVHNGTIDNGYRGELFALTQNLGEFDTVIKAGTRFAQLVLFTCEVPITEQVEELTESVRGESGFGSTTGKSTGPLR